MTDKEKALEQALVSARLIAHESNVDWRMACDATNRVAGRVARAPGMRVRGRALVDALAVEDNACAALHAAMAAENKALMEAEDAGVET